MCQLVKLIGAIWYWSVGNIFLSYGFDLTQAPPEFEPKQAAWVVNNKLTDSVSVETKETIFFLQVKIINVTR